MTSINNKIFVISALMVIALLSVVATQQVQGAVGDYVTTVNFGTACPSGIGVGVAFDGTNLWYSCYASTPDLFKADPTTGAVLASYTVSTGLGAIAYDSTNNVIYAGPGGGNSCAILKIDLDANKNVVGNSVLFSNNAVCTGLDDGLAYDGTDNTFYYSPDGSTIITHFDYSGNVLSAFTWTGPNCYNSGLAIGGNLLFQGSNGCAHVYVVDKVTLAPAYDFATNIGADPNFRDEDLECDTNTFASQGKQVMWSVEAYEPRRALAFEIEPRTCGIGGLPEEICGDGIDNNNNGLIDENCPPPPTEICGDGIDNDGDGLVDEDCPPPPTEICGDGIDNDGDGLVDEDCPVAPTGYMTGGGSVMNGNVKVTHGFEFHCSAAQLPNNLEVNWAKNKFHLNNLGTAACSDDPSISEGNPIAGFDTYMGVGTGSLNGKPGASAEWKFTDAGEPGKNDYVDLEIRDSNNNVVLSVTGKLTQGNHQAHP